MKEDACEQKDLEFSTKKYLTLEHWLVSFKIMIDWLYLGIEDNIYTVMLEIKHMVISKVE